MDLALNIIQRLICYKTQPTNQPFSCVKMVWHRIVVKIIENNNTFWKTINNYLPLQMDMSIWIIVGCHITVSETYSPELLF